MTPFAVNSNYTNSGGGSHAGTDVSGGSSSAARSAMRDRAKRWISTSGKKKEPSGSGVYLDENNSPNRKKSPDEVPPNNQQGRASNIFGNTKVYHANATTNLNSTKSDKNDVSKSSMAELSDAAVESSLQAWDEIAKDDKKDPRHKPQSKLFDAAIATAKLRRNTGHSSEPVKMDSMKFNAAKPTESAAIRHTLNHKNHSNTHIGRSTSASAPVGIKNSQTRSSSGINVTGTSSLPNNNIGRVSKIAERLMSHGRTPSPACPSDECGDSSVPSSPPIHHSNKSTITDKNKQTPSPVAFSPVSFHPPLSVTTANDDLDKEVAYWIDRDSDSAYSSDSSERSGFVKGKNSLPRAPSLIKNIAPVAHKKEYSNGTVVSTDIKAKNRIKVLSQPLQPFDTGIKLKTTILPSEHGLNNNSESPPVTLKSAFVNGNIKSNQTTKLTTNDEVFNPPQRKKNAFVHASQQAVIEAKSPTNAESYPRNATSSSMYINKTTNGKISYDQLKSKIQIKSQVTQKSNTSFHTSTDVATESPHEPITQRPSPRRPTVHSDILKEPNEEREASSKVNSAKADEPAAETVWKIDSIFSQREKPSMKNISSRFSSRSSQQLSKHGHSAFETPKKKSEVDPASTTDTLNSSGIDLSASEQRYYASTGRNLDALKFSSPPSLCRTAAVAETSAELVQSEPLSEAALSIQNMYSPMRRPVNGIAVPGYEGFINKTADMPNLMDQCSVASGNSSVLLEATKLNPSCSLRQRIPRISEDVEPSDVFDGLSSNDGEDPPTSPALDVFLKAAEETAVKESHPVSTLDTWYSTDLTQYCIDPDVAQQLILKYRKMCLRKRNKGDDDHKKAFALFEMRSRIMETDMERGLPRQGGTAYTDDIILTPSSLAAIRVRDTTIVSKAWRDGASPRDLLMASLLTRRSTHCYFIKRPLFVYNKFTGVEVRKGHCFEEVRWLDDLGLFQVRCASLDLMPVRGHNIFTLGDCHSLLLKLTNERCLQLHEELEAACERQLDAEQRMELESRSGDKASMTDVEMYYLASLQDVSEISNKLEQAEKAFSMVQDGIAKLIAKYEEHLAAMYQNDSFDSNTSDEGDLDEDEAWAARAEEAERKAKAAEREALKAKEEAERIRKLKDNEVQSLKSRVEELERQTAAERERSQMLLKQYELKIENLERQSAVGMDSRSMFHNSIHSSQGTEKVELVKKKFRSRNFERMHRNALSERSNSLKMTGKVKQLSKQFERPSAFSSFNGGGAGLNTLQMSEEEMFQHLDFYERVAKGSSLMHI